jgi:hypothetical protein
MNVFKWVWDHLDILAMVFMMAFCYWFGAHNTAKEYEATIATINKDNAQDIADQVSMGFEQYKAAQDESDRREALYQIAVHELAKQSLKDSKKLADDVKKFRELSKSNEEVKRVGDIPTPDVVVKWLQ